MSGGSQLPPTAVSPALGASWPRRRRAARVDRAPGRSAAGAPVRLVGPVCRRVRLPRRTAIRRGPVRPAGRGRRRRGVRRDRPCPAGAVLRPSARAGAAQAPAAAPPGSSARPLAPNAGDIADAATSKAAPPPRRARGAGAVPPPPPGAPGAPGARPGGTPPPGRLPASVRRAGCSGCAGGSGGAGYARAGCTSATMWCPPWGSGRDPAAPAGAPAAGAAGRAWRACWADHPPGGTPPGGVHHAATMLADPGRMRSGCRDGAPQPPGAPGAVRTMLRRCWPARRRVVPVCLRRRRSRASPASRALPGRRRRRVRCRRRAARSRDSLRRTGIRSSGAADGRPGLPGGAALPRAGRLGAAADPAFGAGDAAPGVADLP